MCHVYWFLSTIISGSATGEAGGSGQVPKKAADPCLKTTEHMSQILKFTVVTAVTCEDAMIVEHVCVLCMVPFSQEQGIILDDVAMLSLSLPQDE